MLIYGHWKIGKSTFCSQMDNPLFLATEPGLEALSVYKLAVPDWNTFLAVCGEIAKGKHEYKTIVIDTVDILWKCCAEYIRSQAGIQHESDLGYGKGWEMVKNEFFRALRKLAMLPYGLVLTSHVNLIEVKTQTSVTNKSVPTIPNSGREIILGWVDMILYCETVLTKEGEKRVIRTQPSEKWEAGDRTENAFNKRKLPDTLPLDFTAFQNAFYNKKEEKEDDQ